MSTGAWELRIYAPSGPWGCLWGDTRESLEAQGRNITAPHWLERWTCDLYDGSTHVSTCANGEWSPVQ